MNKARSQKTIGNGNDNTTDAASGRTKINYYNFTPEAKQVYLREVERMVKLGTVSAPTSVAEGNKSVPEDYALMQNYPNPFNPSTNIQFQIPKDGHVSIAIYNTLRQRVATVLDENLRSGSHQVTFDASKLSTGIYFYRITTNEFSQVKKTMLVK